MKKWKLCLVRQQGWIPDLICWFTGSEWNHVSIQMSDGNFLDLDRPGLRVIDRISYLKVNKILVTDCFVMETTAEERMRSLRKLTYGDLDNVAYVVYRLLGLRLNFASSKSSNCVSFCLRLLGIHPKQANYLAPKDLQYL